MLPGNSPAMAMQLLAVLATCVSVRWRCWSGQQKCLVVMVS